jgi:hypothetical protein
MSGRRQAKLARSAGASPAQVRPSESPGSECCVRRRQRRTRSVHSGCAGCVIEPRNDDEINQEWLIRFLEHRIGDRRIIRLIQKWLKSGVMEDGVCDGQ